MLNLNYFGAVTSSNDWWLCFSSGVLKADRGTHRAAHGEGQHLSATLSVWPAGRDAVLCQVVQGRQRVLPVPAQRQPTRTDISTSWGRCWCKFIFHFLSIIKERLLCSSREKINVEDSIEVSKAKKLCIEHGWVFLFTQDWRIIYSTNVLQVFKRLVFLRI